MELLQTTPPEPSTSPVIFGIAAFLLFMFVIVYIILAIHKRSEQDYGDPNYTDPMLEKWTDNEKTGY